MALYIFSDAHLGSTELEGEDKKYQKISQLFELIKKDGDHLVILGDLFDFWFEYKNAIPNEYMKMLSLLGDLKNHGVKIDYVCGNHDFWMGDFFPTQMEIPIYKDEFELVYADRKIFFIHGDGISKNDSGYRLLKKVFRNKLNIWLYQKLPPDWAIPFAKYVSGSSRKYTSKRDTTDSTGNNEKSFAIDYENFAQTKIDQGHDIVAMGHLHKPIYKELSGGLYLNSGDFITHFSYLRIDEDSVKLEKIS